MTAPYYADDAVTLYHGDCRDVREWLSADVLVTDPPYGKAWRRGPGTGGAKAHVGIAGDGDTSVRDAALALWGIRPAVVFGSFYAPFPVALRQVLVWAKPPDAGVVGSTTGYRRDVEAVFLLGEWPQRAVRWSSLLRSLAPSSGNTAGRTGHPHTKPVDLMSQLIARAPSGVVADPFAGSGSTLVAAKGLGRRCIGVEVSEGYCEVAARRLSQGTLALGASA